MLNERSLWRRLPVGATVLLLAATPGTYAASAKPAVHQDTARQEPAVGVPVVAAKVGSSSVPTVLSTLGMVDSLGKTTLTASVTGEIEGPFHTKGEVEAGAVVARNVPAALHGQLANAQAQLQYAHTALRTTQQLARQHLKTALDVALAQRNLVQAKSQLANLRQTARQQVMRAPFTGTLHYLVAPGTVVYRGTPVATISGRATPWIDVRVSPDAAHGITAGEVATIADASWHGNGQVVAVGQEARPWGLVRVRIGLPAGSSLVPGEWASVQLMHRGASAPVVPRAAVVMRGAKAMVFVIRGHRAHAVEVRIVAEAQRQTWVKGAVKVGEKVAVIGVTRLADGNAVSPDPLAGKH